MNLTRMRPLVGEEGIHKLASARVMIVGLGGVGGYCLEALARVGVGTFFLVDSDTVDDSNVNRQILCTADTVGQAKVDAAARRVLSINPNAAVKTFPVFVGKETVEGLPFSDSDVLVDCIDTVTAKILLAKRAEDEGIEAVSCMGSGNRLHADFVAEDLYATRGCPLARAMRRLAKKAEISKLTVIYSTEASISTPQTPASISYVPAQAGLKCAEYVITKILGENNAG